MSADSLANAVRNHLAKYYMRVDDEWLSGCVEYILENNANYSESEVLGLAKEQWLLNDLKDICPGSLPANLKNMNKTVLEGRFVLQINAAMDIGTPAYQQYLKLQKVNQENIDATSKFDDKVPSHRMVKLYLTDGVQEVSAIEYKPMRNLSCDITPGCKALFKGPIECRRGVLLLNENSIELLGGEVQELTVSNSLSGLISAKLGVTITQEPDPNTTLNHPRNANIPTPHTEMPSRFDEPEHSRPIAIVTSLQVSSFTDEDIDIEQLAAIEAQIQNRTTRDKEIAQNINRESSKNTAIVEPVHDIFSRNKTNNESSKRTSSDETKNPEKRPKIAIENNTDDYPVEEDLFFEDTDYLRELEEKFDAHDTKITISSEPFVYIDQINKMTGSEKAGRVFKVKGQIMKLLSKLSVGKDGWSLKCTLVDGTGSIDVDFTSTVLSKLVGYTPQEMNQLKKQMATNPALKEKAVSALQKAKESLQVLYCLIELTMLEVPKITSLTPFESSHVESLRKRGQNFL